MSTFSEESITFSQKERYVVLRGMSAIEVHVVKIHASPNIIHGNHIDPRKWHPLIYNFRHYFGLSEELGKTFRAEL